jgi:hypothetical protein
MTMPDAAPEPALAKRKRGRPKSDKTADKPREAAPELRADGID